jgi:hypothetical protein
MVLGCSLAAQVRAGRCQDEGRQATLLVDDREDLEIQMGGKMRTISKFNSYRPLMAAAVLAAFALTGAANVAAEESSMAKRLQRLEDREAIRVLLERFFEFQEGRNFKAFANLFAKDGEMLLRQGHLKGGPTGILASMTRGSTGADAAKAPASGRRHMRHILSNVYIDVRGDTATAMSRWTMLVSTEDNRTRVGGTGRYSDKLVREKGEWKIQRRVIYRDIPVVDDPSGDPAEN